MTCPLACVVVAALVLSLCQTGTQTQADPGDCSSQSLCGWQSVCQNSTCNCLGNLTLHSNGRDCKNASCTSSDCLQCERPDFCSKCIKFISLSTGQCLHKCEGSSELHGDNLVCTESEDDGVSIVIAIVAGVAAGAVLCIIVIIAVCIYIRRTRKKINLQNKSYSNGQMETGHVKQYPVYDNNAYEGEDGHQKGKIDPLQYVSELDKLRPHADTLMALLSQVRSKTRAMDSSDPRVPTYKGVIHQLCRVLVLLHKKDPVVSSIPSDAMGLLQWANQMLEDHREQQLSNSGGATDIPITQISSVDLDFDDPSHPVYATPERNQRASQLASSGGVASPYSTVPVPLNQNGQAQSHYGSSKRPGFATISRARSIPDSALIRALEADDAVTNMFSANQETASSSPYQTGGLKREDLQNFLINNSGKRDVRTLFSPSPAGQQLSVEAPEATSVHNVSSEKIKVHVQKDNLSNKFTMDDGQNQNPYASSTKTFQPEASSGDISVNRQQSVKKNIITNPNAIKKSGSQKDINPKYAVPKIGYFANGHYYDPNPMPDPEAEVYAPGSNYSNGSNIMSTFLGDLPRSRTPSSSNQSEDGDRDSEHSGGDLDVFPFDLKDATEPVEV